MIEQSRKWHRLVCVIACGLLLAGNAGMAAQTTNALAAAIEKKGVDASDALRFKVDKVSGAVSLCFGAESLHVPVDVRVGLPGWKKIIGAGERQEFVASDIPGGYRLTGRLELESGKACRIEEEITQEGDSCRIRIRLTAEESLAMEGAFLWLDLPVPAYAGSTCTLGAAPAVEFPYTFSEAGTRFVNGEADKVVIEDTLGTRALTLEFDRRVLVRLQDARAWKSDVYNFYVFLAGQTLEKGETAQLSVKLRRLQAKDLPLCNLRVVPERALGRMDGFGGNYCFVIESPVTQYTLKNLRVAWARTEMTPAEWEPRNDNDDPGKTDWEFLKAHDTEGSNLRRELLLAQQIQTSGIPYSITIWRVPEWCYEKPVQGWRTAGGAVKEGIWPEILECIGSYLVYAKKTYGVEPDFFSFNEPNGNTYVKFTPEEHRDAIRRIGAHFKELGLKTRMLLGDVSVPGAYDFILPAAGDAEAMRYVGALSFHTWNGAEPAGYEKWAAAATRLGLPLLVGEVGVDPSAWADRKYRSFDYGLREVRLYQDLIRYARPRGTMQWEFTSDYGLVDEEKDPSTGAVKLVPHARFWFMKHFCDLTPADVDVLETGSDSSDIMVTAFRGRGARGGEFTLHIANFGRSRVVALAGLPAGLGPMRAVRTSQAESFSALPNVKPEQGGLKLTVAGRSLLTLTTLPLSAQSSSDRSGQTLVAPQP